MKRILLGAAVLCMVAILMLSAKSTKAMDSNNDGKPDTWYEFDNGVVVKISTDQNFDGIIDSNVEFSKGGTKKYEEIDFNKDGMMDDFYFYSEGILARREIDSDYDGKIDLWVFLSDDGQYVTRWERDLNGDGVADKIKEFK